MLSQAEMPKPGCYGSPLCHHPAQAPCSQCPFRAACGPLAERVGVALRRKYGIEPLLRVGSHRTARAVTQPAAPVLTPAPACAPTSPSPPGGNIKVQEIVRRLKQRSIDLQRAVAMRTNPFATTPPVYLRVALDKLFDGGFTRAELKAHLVDTQGWTDGTANAHVSIVVGLLFAAGAASEHEGRILPIDREVS